MPRPSQNIDQALLASGRALYPLYGCAGLSVRQICEHAGANLGMFHYHFRSKDNFLSSLLQALYDEVFDQLQVEASQTGTAKQRLRAALSLLARLMRDHGAWIGRVWVDSGLGEEVPRLFLQRNAPRHIGLLMALVQEAALEGDMAALPSMQRFSFLMGSVLAPMALLPAAIDANFLPATMTSKVEHDVFSDAAIAERVDLALAALAPFATHSTACP